MPRRIDIELTSALADGSFTWRAAGARNPKGVVDATLVPSGSAVGTELKVEVEQMLDGIEILSVVKGREKADRDLLEFIPSDKPFEAVIETRAKRERRGGSDKRGSGDKRGGDKRAGDKRAGDKRGRRGGDAAGDRTDAGKGRTGGDRSRNERPRFDPPPEIPQRPKPKRLRPGKARRNELLAEIPEEQRVIAEVTVQGMSAVRKRLSEENAKLKADGRPEMPEASVLKLAEDLLPRLRVADWLDRAEAAQRQMQHLDLRDLRSVVVAGADPIVARDETAAALCEELKTALHTKQEDEQRLWLEDIQAALGVGRVIRALRLSSQPPKAGVMFPPQLARELGAAATQSLQPDDSGDRWAAVMEAAAFSPVRTLVAPTTPPTRISDDLKKTALRLGPPLPHIAALLGVEVPADTPRPKPLRPQGRKDQKGRGSRQDRQGSPGGDSKPKH